MMRPEARFTIERGRVVTHVSDEVDQPRDHQGHDRRQAPLEATRRADADEGPHQESRLKPPMCTKSRFKMFAWPRRCVRRMAPVP